MNVPNIGQGPVSAPVLPRTVAGGENVTPRPVAAAPTAVRSHPVPGISLTRLACFDVNGDGNIDPRSASAGGDATLLVPTHEVDLPTWPHAANPMESAHDRARPHAETRTVTNATAHPAASTAGAAGTANAAQTNRAVGAYQRYGQDTGGAAPARTTAGATPSATTIDAAPAPLAAGGELTPVPAPAPALPGAGAGTVNGR